MRKSETQYTDRVNDMSFDVFVNNEYKEETQIRVVFNSSVWMEKKKAIKFLEGVIAGIKTVPDN